MGLPEMFRGANSFNMRMALVVLLINCIDNEEAKLESRKRHLRDPNRNDDLLEVEELVGGAAASVADVRQRATTLIHTAQYMDDMARDDILDSQARITWCTTLVKILRQSSFEKGQREEALAMIRKALDESETALEPAMETFEKSAAVRGRKTIEQCRILFGADIAFWKLIVSLLENEG